MSLPNGTNYTAAMSLSNGINYTAATDAFKQVFKSSDNSEIESIDYSVVFNLLNNTIFREFNVTSAEAIREISPEKFYKLLMFAVLGLFADSEPDSPTWTTVAYDVSTANLELVQSESTSRQMFLDVVVVILILALCRTWLFVNTLSNPSKDASIKTQSIFQTSYKTNNPLSIKLRHT